MGELNRFLTKYCGRWRSIGYKLGLLDNVLNMIHSNHPTQERECFRVALQKWLELDTRATWSILELAITNACREEMDLEALPESKIHFIQVHYLYMHACSDVYKLAARVGTI